jgi:hypothetical protein
MVGCVGLVGSTPPFTALSYFVKVAVFFFVQKTLTKFFSNSAARPWFIPATVHLLNSTTH